MGNIIACLYDDCNKPVESVKKVMMRERGYNFRSKFFE